MRWVSRAFSLVSARIGNQSGATIIFIAVALVALLAMTAFVIDFGRIWQERRELQIGATAGALAVAEDCARNLCDATYDEFFTAETYADANALDSAASVPFIDLNLVDQTVHVVTATENTAGGDTLDMMFARIVGFDTITVGADATVAWGAPYTLATIPIIISNCEWMHPNPVEGETATEWPGWPAGGALLEDMPVEATKPYATILFHDGKSTEDCNAVAGQDKDLDGKLSGGFGWLDTNGSCKAIVYEDWVDADPGASPSTGCDADELKGILLGDDPVLIPYFFDTEGLGAGGKYKVVDYGALYVLGYNFGGQYKEIRDPMPADPPMTGLPCTGDERCIAGWFVNWVQHGGSDIDPGGDGRGVTVIKLTG